MARFSLAARTGWLIGWVLTALSAPLIAAERAALVVVNQDYQKLTPLAAGATQNLVADALRQAGFAVETLRNASSGEMIAALNRLRSDHKSPAVVVFYFAGYARQMNGTNYLLPTTVALQTAFDLLSQGVDLKGVLNDLRATQAPLQLAVVDGAYAEPVLDRMERLGPALGGVKANGNSLVVLGAPVGRVLDPGASPEVMAKAFGAFIGQPDRPLDAFAEVFQGAGVPSEARRGKLPMFADASLAERTTLAALLQPPPVASVASAETAPSRAAEPVPEAQETSAETASPASTVSFESGLDASGRRRVQETLRGIGVYRGPIDGLFGPLTREAIRIFQRSRGLPASGTLDAALARALDQVSAR